MMFDRRPFYLVGGAVALLVVGYFAFFAPRITPQIRVQEQISLLSQEPWTAVQVQSVQFLGGTATPDQVLLRGRRVADGSEVVVHFVADSPYTASAAIRRLTEQPLEGRTADVLMLPRSLAHAPFRQRYQDVASHVGVAVFAGFPDRPATTASHDTSAEATAASTDG